MGWDDTFSLIVLRIQREYYGRYPVNVDTLIPVGPFDLLYSTFGICMALGYAVCVIKHTMRLIESKKITMKDSSKKDSRIKDYDEVKTCEVRCFFP